MKLNFALPAAIRAALGAQGSEWDPVLIESVQPVVVIPADESTAAASEFSSFNDRETLAGAAYGGWGFSGPVAAQNSGVQLFNPLTSNRNIFIDRIWVASGAGPVRYGHRNVAFGTFVNVGRNADNGGAPSKGEIYTQNFAGVLVDSPPFGFVSPGAATVEIRLDPPARLPPGVGYAITCDVVNTQILAGFHWREYER